MPWMFKSVHVAARNIQKDALKEDSKCPMIREEGGAEGGGAGGEGTGGCVSVRALGWNVPVERQKHLRRKRPRS